MFIITRVLASLEARLNQPWISIWRTIYFNFRTMPFRTAIKFPVFIYGRVHLFGLNGKVCFENTPIKRGMVKIGINGDSFNLFNHSGFVQLSSANSILIFEGPCRVSLNAILRVCAGELRLGEFTRIGTDSKIICNGGKVKIGSFTGITFGCVVMNSGFHYFYDEIKHGYHNRTKNIEIGSYNWIGNRSTISGGCKTKDYSIICSNSLLNKDYTQIEGEHVLLGGIPARLLKVGMKRVFSPQCELEISKYFNQHPEHTFFQRDEIPDKPKELIKEM